MTTPLAQCIPNTDIPWLVDPVTGLVVGQQVSGSFQGALLGQPPVPVAIYPGGQGPLNSFALQSFTGNTVLAPGTVNFFDCSAGSIVATLPTPSSIPAGQTGMVMVVRVDAVANSAAFLTFTVAAGSIAGSNPQMVNGQAFIWVFNGSFWKQVN
jgi:hypothetical protein